MAKLTIRDVAQHAGVGVGTVSRVLNNSKQVSAETRAHVLQTIEQLGFKPDAVARQLARKSRFQYIGVITRPFVDYASFTERLRGVQKALQRYDYAYEMLLFSMESTDNYHDRLMSIITTRAIDGLLVIDLPLSDTQKSALTHANLPFVGVNHFQETDWPCIGTDNEMGGYIATHHLLDLGHRHIAYIGDALTTPDGYVTSHYRYEGYHRALIESGCDAVNRRLVRFGPRGYESAHAMTASLLREQPRPTAIFAMSDMQALGCIAAIQDAGLSVPEDVSVIGYDDLPISEHAGLTTIRQHLQLSGEVGVDYLLSLMQLPEAPPVPDLPPVELVRRDTTASVSG